MKAIDLTNVEEAKTFETPPAGGYICKIVRAKDFPEKEYLKIEYDFAEGKFKDCYRDLCASKGFWLGNLIRSYKEAALPFFKGFITAVENSNPSYKWESDETTLDGKLIGLVLGEEEYTAKDSSTKIRLYVNQVRSVSEIKSGNFEVPLLKKLGPIPGFTPVTNDDDIPFMM